MRTELNQSGMVSIIVSTIIMTVLTLIVLSFAAIMQRERTQSLDRELSTQAFYAAESAINDVREDVFSTLSNGDGLQNYDTCGALDAVSDPRLDDDINISCVTVTTNPGSLEFDSVGLNRSTVFEIKAEDTGGNPTEVETIDFYYDDPDDETNFKGGGVGEFTNKAAWGDGPGMLQVELVPIPTAGFSRDFLRNNNRVYYGFPTTFSNGVINWSSSETAIVSSGCGSDTTWPRACRIRIEDIPSGYSDFSVRIKSIYQPVSVTVAANDILSQAVRFRDAQVVVDSTGRSNDVISRVKEIIPTNFQYDYLESGIEAGNDLCKLIEAEPSRVEVSGLGSSISSCSL